MKLGSLACSLLLTAPLLAGCLSNDPCSGWNHLETSTTWQGTPLAAPRLLSAGGERLLVWYASDGVHVARVGDDAALIDERVDTSGLDFEGTIVTAPDRYLLLAADQATQRTDVTVLAADGTVLARHAGALPGVLWGDGAWTGDGFVVSGQLTSGLTHGVLAPLTADGAAVGDVVETGAGNQYNGLASVVAVGDVVWAVWGEREVAADPSGQTLVGRRYTRALAPIDAAPWWLADHAAVRTIVPSADGTTALVFADGEVLSDLATVVLGTTGAGAAHVVEGVYAGDVVAAAPDPAGGWDVALGTRWPAEYFPSGSASEAKVFRVRADGAIDVRPIADLAGTDGILVDDGQIVVAERVDAVTGDRGSAQLVVRVLDQAGATQAAQVVASSEMVQVEATECVPDDYSD